MALSALTLAGTPNYAFDRTPPKMNVDCSQNSVPDTSIHSRREIQKMIRDVYLCDRDKPGYLGEKDFMGMMLQESKLNPRAVSPVGASGLAQLMGDTWKSVDPIREYDKFKFDPKASPQNGLRYIEWLDNFGRENNPDWDLLLPREKLDLVRAAYNGGITRLYMNDWRIASMYEETRKYVSKIGSLTSSP